MTNSLQDNAPTLAEDAEPLRALVLATFAEHDALRRLASPATGLTFLAWDSAEPLQAPFSEVLTSRPFNQQNGSSGNAPTVAVGSVTATVSGKLPVAFIDNDDTAFKP